MQFVFDLHAAFRRIIKRFPGFLFRKPRKHIFQKGTGIRPAAGVNAQHADLVFSQKVDPVPGDLVRQQNELRFHKVAPCYGLRGDCRFAMRGRHSPNDIWRNTRR